MTNSTMLIVPEDRTRVTGEPAPGQNPGDPTHPLDADWSALVQRGGGRVPEDLFWWTNPKQNQDTEGAG
ncbi:MAG: hypothetical protein ACKVPX_04895 [Myxococcaceae bacterium]